MSSIRTLSVNRVLVVRAAFAALLALACVAGTPRPAHADQGGYRGHEFTVNLLRKVQLQIAVNDEFVKPTVDAILKAGRSGEKGEIGDGKIFILPMDDCIRIRTGERGSAAI